MEGTNPVNKKLAAALSGGAVLVLALSGCTNSKSEGEGNQRACSQAQRQAAPGIFSWVLDLHRFLQRQPLFPQAL